MVEGESVLTKDQVLEQVHRAEGVVAQLTGEKSRSQKEGKVPTAAELQGRIEVVAAQMKAAQEAASQTPKTPESRKRIGRQIADQALGVVNEELRAEMDKAIKDLSK